MFEPNSSKLDQIANLEKLLKSAEFENSLQTQAIEREQENIAVYKKKIEEKLIEVKELEDDTTKLDEDAKQLHKQFRVNKENVESLKHTSYVLDEHISALEKKLLTVKLDAEQQKTLYEESLEKYQKKWNEYEEFYESSPEAMELRSKQNELHSHVQHAQSLENEIKHAEMILSGFYEVQHFKEQTIPSAVKIAEIRANTNKVLELIKANRLTVKKKKQVIEILHQKLAAKKKREEAQKKMELEKQEQDERETGTLVPQIVLPSTFPTTTNTTPLIQSQSKSAISFMESITKTPKFTTGKSSLSASQYLLGPPKFPPRIISSPFSAKTKPKPKPSGAKTASPSETLDPKTAPKTASSSFTLPQLDVPTLQFSKKPPMTSSFTPSLSLYQPVLVPSSTEVSKTPDEDVPCDNPKPSDTSDPVESLPDDATMEVQDVPDVEPTQESLVTEEQVHYEYIEPEATPPDQEQTTTEETVDFIDWEKMDATSDWQQNSLFNQPTTPQSAFATSFLSENTTSEVGFNFGTPDVQNTTSLFGNGNQSSPQDASPGAGFSFSFGAESSGGTDNNFSLF